MSNELFERKAADKADLQVLNGIFDEVLACVSAYWLHRQECAGRSGCKTCPSLAEREQRARTAYSTELKRMFG